MSITTHIKSLNNKHHQLDAKLHDAYIHHLPTEEIAKLKKEKLELKDEITKLSIISEEESKNSAAA